MVQPLERRVLMAAGDLDPTFGGDGSVDVDVAGAGGDAPVLAALPDGKILVAGTAYVGVPATRTSFSITRLNANGSTDLSFGRGGDDGDGHVNVSFAAEGYDFAGVAAVAVRPDGKIVLAGNVVRNNNGSSNNVDVGVVRLNADGSPDGTFGGGDGRVA